MSAVALAERKILYRKSDRLISLKFTITDMDSFFEAGYLPFKVRAGIKTLDTAPNMTASIEFVDALRTHAREGTVQALADLLEPNHSDLTDELLAELMLVRKQLPLDEPTVDEMATLVHREFGHSKKLGPIDQRLLREMLTERILVTRRASYLQLQRTLAELEEEQQKSERRAEELFHQVERLWDYTGAHNIRRTLLTMSPPPIESDGVKFGVRCAAAEKEKQKENDVLDERTHQDLCTLLDDVYSSVRQTIYSIEHVRDEKRRLLTVLEETEQRKFLVTEPVHCVVGRVLEKPLLDIKAQQNKMRAVDKHIADLQLQLARAKRERPVKVATKADTDQRTREKLAAAKEQVRTLGEQEAKMKAELNGLKKYIGGSQQKLGFVARSRTVRIIRRREREKVRMDMASVVKARMEQEAEDDDRYSPDRDLPVHSGLSIRYQRSPRRSRSRSEGSSRFGSLDGRSSGDSEEGEDDDSNTPATSYRSYMT